MKLEELKLVNCDSVAEIKIKTFFKGSVVIFCRIRFLKIQTFEVPKISTSCKDSNAYRYFIVQIRQLQHKKTVLEKISGTWKKISQNEQWLELITNG